ncbi:MAG: hypothetical protein JWQ04_838 [Pedosphaera sp.]|nr:hypothetical protein [Pedosphaera sp.]
MWTPPVIERELRVALRKHGALKSRLWVAVCGAAVAFLFLLFNWVFGAGFSGKGLHEIYFYLGLYLAIVPAARISVGLFCEERQNQTLELLYLTGMGSAELFLGKLFGGILIASSDLLALAPLLAVPFLNGGVSLDLFLATIACFPVLLLFTVAIGVLASVLCRDDGAAFAGAVILGAVACLAVTLPYYLGQTVTGAAPFPMKWLCLSPAFGPYLVWTDFSGNKPEMFWMTAGATLVLTFIILWVAAMILNRTWRQRVVGEKSSGWLSVWQAWVHGSADWRESLRSRLLPENPFQWLAQQDRRPVFLAWSLIGVVCVAWLLSWWAWPAAWPSPMRFFITAFLLLAGVDTIMNYAAARRIGIDRRDGVLELLLTTPLSPAEIVDGQLAALRAQFQPVRWTLFGLCALMMAGGWLTRKWIAPALVSYAVFWCFFFGWCLVQKKGSAAMAMWIALNTGRPAFAVFKFRQKGGWWNNWWWIYWLYNARYFWGSLGHASTFPSGSLGEMVFVCFLGVVLFIVAAARWQSPPEMKARLISEMRLIAREPVPEANDPRFKKWNVRERIPTLASLRPLEERIRFGDD